MVNYALINVMLHLPPPEGDGDKGGDLTTFTSNPHPWGLSSYVKVPYTMAQISYFMAAHDSWHSQPYNN